MSVGENIRRYRKLRGMTQAQLAEAVGLTEGAVRHYESGIRAVKPELLESIAAALDVSVNALKDYGVETAGDLMSLLVRLEDSFGIVPAADGSGLSLNPKAPRAPKAAMAIELWAEKRAQLENGEIDAWRIRGLESLAVAAPRISQSTKSNQDGKTKRRAPRASLRLLSFYSPLHAEAFPACLGSKCHGGLHGSTRRHAAAFPLDTPVSIETARFFTPH